MSEFDDTPEHDLEGEEREKSKSRVKRELKALHDMGVELLAFNSEQLSRLPLNDRIIQTVEEAKRIRKFGGRKRQLKYLGKLLQDVEADALRSGIDALLNKDKQANARFHRLERWRDRLINEGDAALSEFLKDYPNADRQHLRQLIRNSLKQSKQTDQQPNSGITRAARELFRYLRALAEAEDTDTAAQD